jgi:hypothetical protein
MKNIFTSLLISIASLGMVTSVYAEAKETKKVCVDVKDKEGKPVKDAKGNVKQTCKEMKVHQKLEGTKVPEKK